MNAVPQPHSATEATFEPLTPARLDALLEDNLAQPYRFRYDGAGFALDVTREVRKGLPAILRAWRAFLTLDVKVTWRGCWYRLARVQCQRQG